MKNLDDVVKMYLEIDTNYALMITGSWGSGKTYYFKNTLTKQIEDISIQGSELKYKPVLISLFGLKSIEDIQTEIVLSISPYLKNKSLQIGTNLIGNVLKVISKLPIINNFVDKEALGSLKTTLTEAVSSKKIKKGNLVLCFDDLERISPKLQIEEVIGFINSLTEIENSKVIIITNEDKIDKTVYSSIKEKVVGNTIEFLPNQEESLKSIINTKFRNDYQQFLLDKTAFILEIFKNKEFNLRTLSFSISYFEEVYKQANDLLKSEALQTQKESILLDLLKFTICITIEYKNGEVTYKNRKNLLKPYSEIPTLAEFLGQEEAKSINVVEPNYQEKFIKDHYPEGNFKFYISLYEFITGGNILDSVALEQEIEHHYHIEENQIPPQYILYNQLSYSNCFSLTPKEYRKQTSKLYKFVMKGAFALKDYPTIFHFLTRFGNPLNYNLNKLEKSVIKSINKNISNYQYSSDLDFYIHISDNDEQKDHLSTIKQECLKVNSRLQTNKSTSKYIELEELFRDNMEEFYDKLTNDREQLFWQPVFDKFNVVKCYNAIINFSNDTRWQFFRLLKSRYIENPHLEFKPEIDFFQKLNTKIQKKSNSLGGKNTVGFVYNQLYKIIGEIVKKLNSIA